MGSGLRFNWQVRQLCRSRVSRPPPVPQLGSSYHPLDPRRRSRVLACRAWPRRRIEHRATKNFRTKALAGVAQRFAFRVRVRFVALQYSAGPLPDDATVLHHDGALGLVAPTQREAAHGLGGVVPALLRRRGVRANVGCGKKGEKHEQPAAQQDVD